jgi:hypothetical protein
MRQRFGIFINIEKGLDQKMPRMILGILKKAYSPGITLPKNLASGKLQALASSLILLMMATRDEWCQNTLEFFFCEKEYSRVVLRPNDTSIFLFLFEEQPSFTTHQHKIHFPKTPPAHCGLHTKQVFPSKSGW